MSDAKDSKLGPKGPWLIDLDLPNPTGPYGNRFTRIYGNAQSVCFDTTDHEGGSEEGFELTWEEIFKACKEYAQ